MATNALSTDASSFDSLPMEHGFRLRGQQVAWLETFVATLALSPASGP